MTYNVPPAELKRVEYTDMEVPAEGGPSRASSPALFIRIRPFNLGPADASNCMVQAIALLDTGASLSLVPMWSLDKMGIVADEGSRRAVFGPSDAFYAYRIKIGVEIEHDEGWLDIGVISAVVPDTKWSRDPRFHIPFLLGRRGFFDKFDMCISESQKAVWLRKIGGWPQAGSPA